MKIYIAGAISNNPDYMEQFKAAEERLRAAGYEVFNPARNQGYTYKEYIDIGLFELAHCDSIYLLKGWEESAGATLECKYAETVGLNVHTQEEEELAKFNENMRRINRGLAQLRRMVEKNKAKKIIYGNGCYGCPTCNKFTDQWREYEKCPNCGQALDWEVY